LAWVCNGTLDVQLSTTRFRNGGPELGVDAGAVGRPVGELGVVAGGAAAAEVGVHGPDVAVDLHERHRRVERVQAASVRLSHAGSVNSRMNGAVTMALVPHSTFSAVATASASYSRGRISVR